MNREEFHQECENFRLFTEGHVIAFEFLYNHYWELLFNYSYKLLEDKDVVADLIQEVFCDIWNRREQLSHVENPRAFFFQCIRNQVYKYLRKVNYQNRYFSFVQEEVTVADSESELIFKDYNTQVASFVSALPEKRQRIFKMRYEDNLTTKEISSLLNISQKTVQNQLNTVVVELKNLIIR